MDSFRRDRQDYPKVGTGTVLGSLDQLLIDSTGGPSSPYEGAHVTGWYPVASDKRWDPMRKVIKEQAFGDNRIDPADAGVQTTWIAYNVLKSVVESLGDSQVTSLAIRHALDNGLKVTTGRLTPTLSWRYEDLIAAVDFPRLVMSTSPSRSYARVSWPRSATGSSTCRRRWRTRTRPDRRARTGRSQLGRRAPRQSVRRGDRVPQPGGLRLLRARGAAGLVARRPLAGAAGVALLLQPFLSLTWSAQAA